MNRVVPAVVLLLFALPAVAQDVQLQRRSGLPDKPEPAIAYLGQYITKSETLPEVPVGLVLAPRKMDGGPAWHLEQVGSCFWCGEPMTFKQAAFDKKAISLWSLRTALAVADIEVTHRSACFRAGTCREGNPMLGQTRMQAYAVSGGMILGAWMLTSHLRAGNKAYRVGGAKYWWLIPVVHQATSVAGIVANLIR